MIFTKKIHFYRLLTRVLYTLALYFTVAYVQNGFKQIILITTLLAGVFFCGWLCPFGAIQEYVGKLGKKVLKKRYRLPAKIHKYLQWSRYIFLFLLPFVFASAILYDPQFATVQLLTIKFASITAIISIIFFIILSFFVDRPFCNYLCMEGARYSLFSLPRIFSINRDKKKCISCKLCDKACPMNLTVSTVKSQRHPSCVNCFKCVTVCPSKALDYNVCAYVRRVFKKRK